MPLKSFIKPYGFTKGSEWVPGSVRNGFSAKFWPFDDPNLNYFRSQICCEIAVKLNFLMQMRHYIARYAVPMITDCHYADAEFRGRIYSWEGNTFYE